MGDLANAKNLDYVASCIKLYSEDFDICVSGINLDSLDTLDMPTQRYLVASRNSTDYFVYCFTAACVLLLDDTIDWHRWNKTQMVGLLGTFSESSDHPMTAFRKWIDHYTSVTRVLLFNEDRDKRDQIAAIGVETILFHASAQKANTDEVLQSLDLRNTSTDVSFYRPVFFIADTIAEIVQSSDNILQFAKSLRKHGFRNIILLCDQPFADQDQTFTVVFKPEAAPTSATVRNLIARSNGIVIPCGAKAITYCESEFNSKDRAANGPVTCVVPAIDIVKQFFLHPDLCAFVNSLVDVGKKEAITTMYRESLYERYRTNAVIRSTKVSVVVCRYNTPDDLLLRCIHSALDSPHQAIEVILVDDGSQSSIESLLTTHFRELIGTKLKYHYRENNEGLGPARNFGVRHADGDYVCFLDTDDIMDADAIPLLLAHAVLNNLDCVVGNIIVSESDLRVRNVALHDLADNVYKVYRSDLDNNPCYSAQMAQAKMIKTAAFQEHELWFEPGYYEDSYFSARLYSRIHEYHFVNLPFYYWVRYESKRDTISSAVGIRHFQDKLVALDASLSVIPGTARSSRFAFGILNDLKLFMSQYDKFSDKEFDVFFQELRSFLANHQDLVLSCGDVVIKALAQVTDEGNPSDFVQFLRAYKQATGAVETQPRADFICFTHYHLVASLLLAIQLYPKKSRFFIYGQYETFSQNTLDELRKLRFTESVVLYRETDIAKVLYDQIHASPADAKFIIPDILNTRFARIFAGCNPDDDIYCFNDKMPVWYYICRTFTNIYRLEDAYDSFSREVKFLDMTGYWGEIVHHIPQDYPKINYQAPEIKEILLFSQPKEKPDAAMPIRVIDFPALQREYSDELARALHAMYSLDRYSEEQYESSSRGTVLILTQALALAKLCTIEEQRRLYRTIAQGWGDRHVIIKPHPADTLSYDGWGATVLDKGIPVEALNFSHLHVDIALTFSSSSIATITFADRTFRLFGDDFTNKRDITKAIATLGTRSGWRHQLAQIINEASNAPHTFGATDVRASHSPTKTRMHTPLSDVKLLRRLERPSTRIPVIARVLRILLQSNRRAALRAKLREDGWKKVIGRSLLR